MRPKSLFLPILLVVIPSICFLIFNDKGLVKVYTTTAQLDQIERSIDSLKEENENLRKEIERLNGDMDYLEQVLRDEYGYVRPNELVFQFKDH